MKNQPQQPAYAAFLRGINVGGRHKVPMAELKTTLSQMGFSNIKTLLNSGNVVFTAAPAEITALETQMADTLEQKFGFPIPVLLRKLEDIQGLVATNPFKDVEVHKDIRLYVTFLRNTTKGNLALPWVSPDGSFQILSLDDKILVSILDISQTKTTDAMNILEKNYTKDITTRNWNTILKISHMT
jgi:uncharacterized protein (DUF1697 family)